MFESSREEKGEKKKEKNRKKKKKEINVLLFDCIVRGEGRGVLGSKVLAYPDKLPGCKDGSFMVARRSRSVWPAARLFTDDGPDRPRAAVPALQGGGDSGRGESARSMQGGRGRGGRGKKRGREDCVGGGVRMPPWGEGDGGDTGSAGGGRGRDGVRLEGASGPAHLEDGGSDVQAEVGEGVEGGVGGNEKE